MKITIEAETPDDQLKLSGKGEYKPVVFEGVTAAIVVGRSTSCEVMWAHGNYHQQVADLTHFRSMIDEQHRMQLDVQTEVNKLNAVMQLQASQAIAASVNGRGNLRINRD